jgi:hypothetical protein
VFSGGCPGRLPRQDRARDLAWTPSPFALGDQPLVADTNTDTPPAKRPRLEELTASSSSGTGAASSDGIATAQASSSDTVCTVPAPPLSIFASFMNFFARVGRSVLT